MKDLNIYYSNGSLDAAIQAALEDGTFAHYVRQALAQETTSLELCGMEPSINGKYFNKFIIDILDYSKYIHYINIPTNGQSLTFYDDFIAPLLLYCIAHRRELVLQLQFSLNGPPDLHDKYHGEGSYKQCIKNLEYIQSVFPYNNPYLKLYIQTKSILRGPELETYSPQKWKAFMANLLNQFRGRQYILWGSGEDGIQINPFITVELPGNYTAAQGRALKNWVDSEDGLFFKTDGTYCQGNPTIDYQGNLYDYHLNFDLTTLRADFEQKMTSLVAAGEAIEQDRNKLFNAIMSIYCWTTANNDIPESYIKLMGNGVLL